MARVEQPADLQVRAGSTFEAGVPRELFQSRLSFTGVARYTVMADGRPFLMNVPVTDEPPFSPLTVVVNWTAGLKR